MARILVVDDDPDILKVAEKVLTTADYEVYLADDALKAMDMINTTPFDAIITDANMPHYSGFELVSTLKNNKRFKNVAIAMLTGLREKSAVDKAIRAGVDDYIVKPLDPIFFLKKVENLFIKKPPQKRPEITFSETSTFSEAQIRLKTRVESISELGMTIKCTQPFELGSMIHINSDIFERIGIPSQYVKVLQCDEVRALTWKVRVGFVGTNESVRQKIRAFVYSQSVNHHQTGELA